jgi:Bax protein
MRPLLEAENARVLADRQRLQRIAEHPADLGWLDRRRLVALAEAYRIEDPELSDSALVDELLLRVDAVPVSLGLAQAAKESGWGTSRFAAEGFNLYGQRCFDPGCGMIPKARKQGLRHELARFDSPSQGVASYLRNLNTHRDYAAFRQLRARLRNDGKPVLGAHLAETLVTYSERGNAYIRDIKQMIRVNGLSGSAVDG